MAKLSIEQATLIQTLKGKHLFIDHSGWYICTSSGREFSREEITALDLQLRHISTSETTGRSTYVVR